MAFTRSYRGRGDMTAQRTMPRTDGGSMSGGSMGGGITSPTPQQGKIWSSGGKPYSDVNPQPRVPPYIKSGPQDETPMPRVPPYIKSGAQPLVPRRISPWRNLFAQQMLPEPVADPMFPPPASEA